MKSCLVFLCLFFSPSAPVQHFKKCTTYYQDHNKYGDDSFMHIENIEYYNESGRLIRREDFAFIGDGDIKFDSVCRGWTNYFYKCDTILMNSLYCHFRDKKKTKVDTSLRVFHYDNQGVLIVDTTFYSGNISWQFFDLITTFIGRGSHVIQYFYDSQGHKAEELETDRFIYDRSKKLGYKKRQTFVYDKCNRLVKRSLSYLYNSNKNDRLSDIGYYVYAYADSNLVRCSKGDLVLQTQYSDYGSVIVIRKEKHTYIYDNHGVIEEMIDIDGKRKKIIDFGYFPDKRKIRETEYEHTRSYFYD